MKLTIDVKPTPADTTADLFKRFMEEAIRRFNARYGLIPEETVIESTEGIYTLTVKWTFRGFKTKQVNE